jgi:uncharacterized protein (TIGR03000 family)
MLRRWIPVLGLLTLVGAGLLLTASPASASLRDRWAARRGYYYNNYPTVTVTESQVIPTTTITTTEGTTTATQPVFTTTEPNRRYYRNGLFRRGRSDYYYPTSSPVVSGTMMSTTGERRSFYNGPAGTAQVNVLLPADAEITIEGKKMSSTGSSRLFVTPTLEPGKTYTYDLHAMWMENGKEVIKDRKVSFKPDELVTVDLKAQLLPAPSPRTK